MSDATTRVLTAADRPMLDAFLALHADTTLFFQSNLLAVGMVDDGQRYSGAYVARVEAGAITDVAAQFWNGMLMLRAPAHAAEVAQAVVAHTGRAVAGLLGVSAEAQAARAGLGMADRPTTTGEEEILFALPLDALRMPEALETGAVLGRPARADDLDTLLAWRVAYLEEALGQPTTDTGREELTQHLTRLVQAGGNLWVVEAEGALVSMTQFNAQTPRAVQVGGVYTPPALRGKGYARAAVAVSLRDARATGVERSILSTTKDNHAAIRCYAKLGYERIGDFALMLFEA